jgi:hypothetical protein
MHIFKVSNWNGIHQKEQLRESTFRISGLEIDIAALASRERSCCAQERGNRRVVFKGRSGIVDA